MKQSSESNTVSVPVTSTNDTVDFQRDLIVGSDVRSAVVATFDKLIDDAAETDQGYNRDTHIKADERLENIEKAVDISVLTLAIAFGSTGFGVPFIPIMIGISLALKSYITSFASAEDILLIWNMVHMYAILISYPSVYQILKYKEYEARRSEGDQSNP